MQTVEGMKPYVGGVGSMHTRQSVAGIGQQGRAVAEAGGLRQSIAQV